MMNIIQYWFFSFDFWTMKSCFCSVFLFLTAEVIRGLLQLSFIPYTLMYRGVSNSPKLALSKSPQGDNSISKCKFQPHVEGTLLLPSPGEQWGFLQTWLPLTLLLFSGSGFSTLKESGLCWERIRWCKAESLLLVMHEFEGRKVEMMRKDTNVQCLFPLSINYDLCEVLTTA